MLNQEAYKLEGISGLSVRAIVEDYDSLENQTN